MHACSLKAHKRVILKHRCSESAGCDSANVTPAPLNSSPADFAGLDFSRLEKVSAAKSDTNHEKKLANFRKKLTRVMPEIHQRLTNVPFLEENDMMRIHPMKYTVSRLWMWLKRYSHLTRPASERDRGLIKERVCSCKQLKKS